MRDCRYLICFAFEEEARIFRARISLDSSRRILLTGMGAASARESMKMIHSVRPQTVLTCGFAGGLSPQLHQGDVVFDADPQTGLEKRLMKAGARQGRFLHVDKVLWKSEDKLTLWRSVQADAVDMESQIIRGICQAAGIPSATVRAISDTATEDLPLDFNKYLFSNGQPRWIRLGGALLRSPSLIPRLIRMRKGFRLAANQLARVLCAALES